MGDLARQSKSGAMSEVTKWHGQITASVLRDIDRPNMPVTAAAYAASSKCVPPHVFEYQKVKPEDGEGVFSLGEEALQTLALTPAPWPTPSPMSIKSVPVSWLFSLHAEGDAGKIGKAWLSLLAERRTMVYNLAVAFGGLGSSIIHPCTKIYQHVFSKPLPTAGLVPGQGCIKQCRTVILEVGLAMLCSDVSMQLLPGYVTCTSSYIDMTSCCLICVVSKHLALSETKHGIFTWRVTSIKKDSARFYTPVAAIPGQQSWSLLPVTQASLDFGW